MFFYQFIIAFLISASFSNYANCLTKTYIASNQWFENPEIWSAKRLPCKLDTVILPDNVAIYFNKSISASKIILPKNGILILDQKNLISKVNEKTCTKGQENKLIIHKNDWFDTSNWNVKYHTFDFNGDEESTNPVPHINRIPCRQDEAQFKLKTTFKITIDLNEKSYKLKNLIINNKKLLSHDLKQYMKSKIGALQFDVNGQLSLSANVNNSSQHSAQICEDNFNFFLNKICRNVVSKCPKLNCIKAIRPIGFCCDVCGSIISIKDQSMDHEFIESRVIKIHLEKYYEVNFFVSKISKSEIEIILIDSDKISRKSRIFAEKLVRSFKTGNFYHFMTIEHQFSEYSDEQTNLGYLVIITFVFVFLILLSIYYANSNRIVAKLNLLYQLISRKSESSSDTSFTFVRFASDHDEEIGEHAKNEFQLRSKYESISNKTGTKGVLFSVNEQNENISFDNPFFLNKNSPIASNTRNPHNNN